jgi:excisionase family DNA binding protein
MTHSKGTYKQYPVQDDNETIVGNNVTVISPYMTKKELAEYLKCSTRTIERMTNIGMLKATRFSKRKVIYYKDENRIK